MAPCTAPLGLYAPPSAAAPHGYSVTGLFGKSGVFDVKIGVDTYASNGDQAVCIPANPNTGRPAVLPPCVYVLTSNPDENGSRGIGCKIGQVFNPPTTCAETASADSIGPATGANGGCSENAPAAGTTTTVTSTNINPWDDGLPLTSPAGGPIVPKGIQGQTASPMLTLFAMDTTTGYLYYQATIKVDDHNATNGPAIPPGIPGPTLNGALTSVLPNARLMVVESGFRGCDLKGRHGPEAFGGITWSPQAGVGGAFLVSITGVGNNPPICYIASLDNLCGPSTTNPGTTTVITSANAAIACPGPTCLATVPPGPGAFLQNFMGQSYIPGPWLGCALTTGSGPGCVPGQGGAVGGCQYPSPTPAPANLIGSVNNQTNGGFQWVCDGALAMIDPVYVYNRATRRG